MNAERMEMSQKLADKITKLLENAKTISCDNYLEWYGRHSSSEKAYLSLELGSKRYKINYELEELVEVNNDNA